MVNVVSPCAFFLALRADWLDDHFDCQFRAVNQEMPTEVVIMQLRAFLKNLEDGYFTAFNEHSDSAH